VTLRQRGVANRERNVPHPKIEPAQARRTESGRDGGSAVLVLEDEAIIALDICDALADAGHDVLGPCEASADALKLLETVSPDLAVLDVKLRDGSGLQVARELSRRRIPFVFYSAEPPDASLQSEFPDAPTVQKPASMRTVMAALRNIAANPAPIAA
jgi:DNA-binding response OmpR family regulator